MTNEPPFSKEYNKKCISCGCNFKTKHSISIYCSRKCGARYRDTDEANELREKRKLLGKSPYPFRDLSGSKFGRLTAVDRYSKNGRLFWRCICDCGNEAHVRADALYGEKTKSCGCFKKDSRDPFSFVYKHTYNDYVARALKRGREFSLSAEEFNIFMDGDCYYCGISGGNLYKIKYCDKVISLKYNGIDRVDNDIGYVYSNCVSCCDRCNKAKFTGSTEEFIEWLKRASDYATKNF
jgi:hypothetical protein